MTENQIDKIQLMCLPFAGGNESSYLKFSDYLDSKIEMVSVLLPGKGKRIREKPLTNIHDIVNEIGEQCKKQINNPYAIYGHSMGALLSHLLVYWLITNGVQLPKHLFLSSYIAPSHHHSKRRQHLSNEEFISRLKALNGLPKQLLSQPKLLNIFLPIIRADINAIDNYKYTFLEPHNIPMSIITGSEESGLMESLKDWQLETTAAVKFYRMKGDHFFIFQETALLCQLINKELVGELVEIEK